MRGCWKKEASFPDLLVEENYMEWLLCGVVPVVVHKPEDIGLSRWTILGLFNLLVLLYFISPQDVNNNIPRQGCLENQIRCSVQCLAYWSCSIMWEMKPSRVEIAIQCDSIKIREVDMHVCSGLYQLRDKWVWQKKSKQTVIWEGGWLFKLKINIRVQVQIPGGIMQRMWKNWKLA